MASSGDREWDYRTNRYLRFESRASFNQRYQTLLICLAILTDDGRVGLTGPKLWHQLFWDVLVEMFVRGEPPVPHSLDPSYAPAILFPDNELCT